MSSQETILQQLIPVIRKAFNNPSLEITVATTAADVQEWTSLTHMSLIAEVEDSFSIEFSLSEVMSFRNVGDMVTAIINKKN